MELDGDAFQFSGAAAAPAPQPNPRKPKRPDRSSDEGSRRSRSPVKRKDRGDRGRRRRKSSSASSRSRRARKKHKQTRDQDPNVLKTCKRCKKKKPSNNFYASQNDCKECAHHWKNVKLFVKRQDEEEWFKGLSEAEQEALVKAYIKTRSRAEKDRSKIKFSARKYREELDGAKVQHTRRLMNEAQFVKWAQSTEGENMTKKQAEDKWLEMLESPDILKVGDKCAVKIFTDMVDYSDLSKKRSLDQESKLAGKMTDEDLREKTNNLLLSGSASSGLSLDTLSVADDLAGLAMDAEAGSTPATSVFNSDVRVMDMKQLAAKPRRVRQGGSSCARSHQRDPDSDSCENKKEAPGSDNKEKGRGGGGGDKPDKWFDAGAALAKSDSWLSCQPATRTRWFSRSKP